MATALVENKPGQRHPHYRPRRRRPDHNVLRWTSDNIFQSEGTTYDACFQPFSKFSRLPPIVHKEELGRTDGLGEMQQHSLYKQDYEGNRPTRPIIYRPTDKLVKPQPDPTPVSTSYIAEYPPITGFTRPRPIPNKTTWDPGADAVQADGNMTSVLHADFQRHAPQKPRTPANHDNLPYRRSSQPLESTTHSASDFQWKYQPRAQPFKPAGGSLGAGEEQRPFYGRSEMRETFKPYRKEDYVRALVDEEWPEERKSRPRHMRSPPRESMYGPDVRPKPRRASPPPVVAPVQASPQETAPPDPHQPQLNHVTSSKPDVTSSKPEMTSTKPDMTSSKPEVTFGTMTQQKSVNRYIEPERKSMYATTYGADFAYSPTAH